MAFVKQTMANAAGYFFDLALETTVPELKAAKDFLQKMAADINQPVQYVQLSGGKSDGRQRGIAVG